jgi:hypothetical protein
MLNAIMLNVVAPAGLLDLRKSFQPSLIKVEKGSYLRAKHLGRSRPCSLPKYFKWNKHIENCEEFYTTTKIGFPDSLKAH